MAGAADEPASVPRELLRILRRHPAQLPERLMLFAVQRLGEPTRAWGERIRAQAAEAELAARCAAEVRATTAASRIDGAVAGTPFFIALVPAYVTFLWTQARMVLRIAALQGRDTTDAAIAAELLALRGVHPSVEAAADALAHLEEQPPAASGWRERGVVWFELVRRILILAAFAGPRSPDEPRQSRLRQVVFTAIGVVIWLGTYVFPVTFMVVLAWGCNSSTRQLGAVALDYYGVEAREDPAAAPDSRLTRSRRRLARVRDPRALLWSAAIGLTIAGPLVLIALAVGKRDHAGAWVSLVAPIAGLALVLALAASTRTRT
jgi:hypothetical protein